MDLCIEGSIKISYREIEMFHLPGHSIAVEVNDKQGDDSPFLVISIACFQCWSLL